jgi:hypothetical protein
MTESRAYEELVDFIATGPSSELVATFQPSEATREHVADLVAREKATGLSAEEASELDHYVHLEHVMRLAKARARKRLTP